MLLGEHGAREVAHQDRLPQCVQYSPQRCDSGSCGQALPQLLPYATSTIGSSSDLQFADFRLQSEEGAQQGDPLGPLYFCLVIMKLLESMLSELVLGYLDDITLGDEAASCLKDFLNLEATASR
jgi:hypothetical protein